MIISIYLYWTENPDDGTRTKLFHPVIGMYLGNLLVNKLWYTLFFGMGMPWLALFDCLLIVTSGFVLIVLFAVENAWWSFSLMWPYLLWSAYATYLTAAFMQVDRRSANTAYKNQFTAYPGAQSAVIVSHNGFCA
jgi:tryptophan-rich sensory protein